MTNSKTGKPDFVEIAHRFLRLTVDPERSISGYKWKLGALLEDMYTKGWEDGMSEGTEHAEQLTRFKNKYE